MAPIKHVLIIGMKNITQLILTASAALTLASSVNAQLISVGEDAFSAAATTVDFSQPTTNETAIGSAYNSAGVDFSGSLFTMQNYGDLMSYENNGDGQIASNWVYNNEESDSVTPGLQGSTWTATFDSAQNKLGFFSTFWQSETLTAEAFNGASSLGSISFIGNIPSSYDAAFSGFSSMAGFDSVVFTITGDGNHFFSMDDFRFEGMGIAGAVPEPSTYGILGALALISLVVSRRIKGV